MKDLVYSNNVYDLRTEKHKTQDDMARDLGISRRTISKIENDDQNISLEMACLIAAYFGLLVSDVFPINQANVSIGTTAPQKESAY